MPLAQPVRVDGFIDRELETRDRPIDRGAIGGRDRQRPISEQRELQTMEMYQPMMEPAQPHEVPDTRSATSTVLDDVMSIESALVMATRKLTTPMMPRQPPAL